MEYLIAIGISFGVAAIIAFFWVRGIDNMQKNYPDYKGEEFLNWDRKNDDWDKVPTNAGRDGWDDNAVHTEGEIR